MDGPRTVDTIEELVAGATDRRSVRSSDATSGSAFELLTLEGRSCFLKVSDAESDWIMRVTWAPRPPCALRPGLPTSSTSTLSTNRYEPGSRTP